MYVYVSVDSSVHRRGSLRVQDIKDGTLSRLTSAHHLSNRSINALSLPTAPRRLSLPSSFAATRSNRSLACLLSRSGSRSSGSVGVESECRRKDCCAMLSGRTSAGVLGLVAVFVPPGPMAMEWRWGCAGRDDGGEAVGDDLGTTGTDLRLILLSALSGEGADVGGEAARSSATNFSRTAATRPP